MRAPLLFIPLLLLSHYQITIGQDSMQKPKLADAPVAADDEWHGFVANGGGLTIDREGSMDFNTPISQSVAFIQRAGGLKADYVWQAKVKDIETHNAGWHFLVASGPLGIRPPALYKEVNGRAKITIYVNSSSEIPGRKYDEFYIMAIRASGEYLCWTPKGWIGRWESTGVRHTPAGSYILEIERKNDTYVCRVKSGARNTDVSASTEKVLVESGALGASELRGAEDADVLVFGDPWTMYTYGKVRCVKMSLNDHPVELKATNLESTGPVPIGKTDRLKIRIGEPRTISNSVTLSGSHLFPLLERLNDGTLLLSFNTGPDVDYTKRVMFRSTNNGQTWTRDPDRTKTETCICQVDENTVLAFEFYLYKRDTGAGDYFFRYFKSSDAGKTFTGPFEAPCTFPGETWCPNPNRRLVGMHLMRTALRLPDGRLIMTLYGYFKPDTKYRSVLVESKDEGETWSYLSTIAYDPQLGGEGPCEPVVCSLPNNELLSMMRVSSFRPMVQCRSNDGGATWSPPEIVTLPSVLPDMVALQNGVIACSYGRPGDYIAFSLDNGKTWCNPIPVFVGGTTGYTAIREIVPNRLLYCYDASGIKEDGKGPFNCIRCVEIDVQLEN